MRMTVVLTTIAVLLLIWWLLRFLPATAEAHMPMPYSTALDRHLWVPAVVGAIWSAILGYWWGFALYMALLILVVAGESPYYRHLFGKPSETPHPDDAASDSTTDSRTDIAMDDRTSDTVSRQSGKPIHAMTLNCRYGRANAADIVRLVREQHIDVLALEELTPALLDRLAREGLDVLLPYCQQGVSHNDDNGGFNAIWSRAKPMARTATFLNIHAADVPAVSIGVDAQDTSDGSTARAVTVAAAHTKSPMRGCREWSYGVRALDAIATSPEPVVVLGDLNACLDHRCLRDVLATGVHDASLDVAHGPTLTYPSWVPWPRIELDHALANSGVVFHSAQAITVRDTDHRALLVTLSVR
ncbi:endonuclease/exonuclease/phosphatase family protein [Bifidobacterium apri]|uniref:endonuclease/exonuclease/phosphatase family protein n=1 Tax=Bifidobacterium apri TaxID=1769423 RepID=UPI003996A8FE